MAASSDYSIVAILLITALALSALILLLTHAVGPKRHGATKDSTYESGVDPLGDARRRFNVKFYLVAVLFLVFDVEIIFLYPWAVVFPKLKQAGGPSPDAPWAGALVDAGYGTGFFLVSIGLFFVLLTVGFVYEWRKGIFKWD